MSTLQDLTNRRFGRLVVIHREADQILPSGYKNVMWKCRCDCGREIITRSKSLLHGVTQSCGCLVKDLLSQRAGKHYKSGTRLYAIWDSMRERCNNPNNHSYKNYGGRGITIVSEWDDYEKFYEWAISSGYDETAKRGLCTLDRINVNGCYSPENCRWATIKKQSNNKRNTILLTYNNTTCSLSEWAEQVNIKYQTLWRRYKAGWNVEKILNTPVK